MATRRPQKLGADAYRSAANIMWEARSPGRLLGCLYSKPKRCRATGKSNAGAANTGRRPLRSQSGPTMRRRMHGGGEVSEAGQNDRADPAAEFPVVPGGVYRPFEAGEG